jgi:predicted nucleic-acid-binding protein
VSTSTSGRRMRAADTNLLVRVLTRNNPEQVARVEVFIEGGAWVSHLVLAETMWGPSRASLRFSDCLILEVARAAGHVPLLTFDRSLATLDGAVRL